MKSLAIFLVCLIAFTKENGHAYQNQDEAKIKMLFQNLMFDKYFAYTLFGTKPITFYDKFHEPSLNSFIKPRFDDLFFQYWKIWKKYSIKTPNYAFIEFDDGHYFYLIFVNKNSVLKIIEKHITVFTDHYQKKMSAKDILENILTTKDYFVEFGNNEIIYGLLFGFGYTNSLAYFLKYEKEYFYLEGVSFHDEPQYSLYRIPLPFFLVFKSNDEVLELRKTYQRERKEIIDHYSKGDFLKTTLEKLTSID